MKKLIVFILFFTGFCAPAYSATRTISPAGGNYSSTGTWVEGAVPTSADTVTYTATSGNLVIDSSAAVCAVISLGGYTGTISGTGQWWCYGSWTFNTPANMSMTGNFAFKAGNSSTTATWTPAGQTFPGNFIANGTGQKTLSGSGFTVTGTMSWLQTCNFVATGLNIDVLAGWTGTAYFNDNATTNATVTIRGGTITGTLPNSTAGCILEPSVSDITFATGIPYQTQIRETTYLIVNPSTYSIIHGANTQTYFIAFTGTLKTANMVWNSIYWASGQPTLEEDFYIYELGVNNNSTAGFLGAGKVCHVLGNWPMRATNTFGGTATIRVEGTGVTLWAPTLNGSTLDRTLNINAPVEFAAGSSATIYGKAINFGGGGSLTDNSGSVTISAGFAPYINGTFTWDFDATLGTLAFLTNTDVLNILDDLTVGTLNMYAGSTIHGANGKTLTISTAVNAGGNETASNIIDAISGTFYLDYLGTHDNQFFAKTDFEDIDASGSDVPISTWHGSATNCTNIRAVDGDNIKTLAYGSA